jgi:hypothetical protein
MHGNKYLPNCAIWGDNHSTISAGASEMNKINILIAMDVIGALAARTLQGYVYLVDTNKYLARGKRAKAL